MTSSTGSATGTTRWNGTPSRSPNTVRNASWRATTSPIAARSAPTSSLPRSRSTSGKLYADDVPSSCCTSHSRRWAKDSGSSSGRSSATTAGRAAAREPPARTASSATVGASNRSRMASSVSSAVRALLISRVASSEWPPSSKKLSSTPILGTPRTSENSSHSTRSCRVRGSRPPAAEVISGLGNARTSSLPLTVSGNESTATIAVGTMYSGSRVLRPARRAAGSAVPTT